MTETATEGKKRVRPHRTDTIWLHPRDIIIIGIDTPHKSFAEHALWDPRIHDVQKPEDIDSIREKGVIVNVLVNLDGKSAAGNRYRMVDGRGRTLKARIVADEQEAAGIPREDQIHVPCTRVSGTDVELMLMSRAANAGRTIDSDYRNAQYANALLAKGATREAIAKAFGVVVGTVRNWLALLDLGPEGVEAVETGLISATAGVVVAQLPRDEQAAQLKEIKADADKGIKPTVERLNQKVREKLGKAPAKTPRARVGKATEVITGFADAYEKPGVNATKADWMEAHKRAVAALNKVSIALTDSSLAKLADTSD